MNALLIYVFNLITNLNWQPFEFIATFTALEVDQQDTISLVHIQQFISDQHVCCFTRMLIKCEASFARKM